MANKLKKYGFCNKHLIKGHLFCLLQEFPRQESPWEEESPICVHTILGQTHRHSTPLLLCLFVLTNVSFSRLLSLCKKMLFSLNLILSSVHCSVIILLPIIFNAVFVSNIECISVAGHLTRQC